MSDYLNAHLAVAKMNDQIAGARTARLARDLPVEARRRRHGISLPTLTRRARPARRTVGSFS